MEVIILGFNTLNMVFACILVVWKGLMLKSQCIKNLMHIFSALRNLILRACPKIELSDWLKVTLPALTSNLRDMKHLHTSESKPILKSKPLA